MSEYNTSDLIMHAAEGKALDFQNTFESILKDKLQTAVESKKFSIADSLFGESVPIEEAQDEGTMPPVTEKDKKDAVKINDIPELNPGRPKTTPPKPKKKPSNIANKDPIGDLINNLEGEK